MAGLRHSPNWQTAVTVALPTSTRPAGYHLGTVAVAATTTYRTRLKWARLTYQGSAGVGYTPTEGDLAEGAVLITGVNGAPTVSRPTGGGAGGPPRGRFL